ncbi:MAG: hypothetical protein ACKUBY_03250 [Candidatus Moraniibacteriota bacterium]|jgi:hypothetical protein
MESNNVSFEKFVETVVSILDSVSKKRKELKGESDEEFLKSTFETIKKRKGYVEMSDATLTGETMRAQLKVYEW